MHEIVEEKTKVEEVSESPTQLKRAIQYQVTKQQQFVK